MSYRYIFFCYVTAQTAYLTVSHKQIVHISVRDAK